MGAARELAEGCYQAFGDGEHETATGYFADGCISVTPGGALDNAAHEVFWDQLTMLGQLGALPPR